MTAAEVETTTTTSAIGYEDRVKNISIISKPLASKKLTKKLYKLVKKSTKVKATKRGVKEVVKALRKGVKGTCLIAGDISPVDVISHLPVLCEEAEVNYIYVPSRQDLGTAACSKRPTSCILINPTKDGFNVQELYDEAAAEVKKVQVSY